MSDFVGTPGDDSLFGSSNDDNFTAGAGNDTIEGGAGNDVAIFSGAAAGYRFGYADGKLTVTDINPANGDNGTDTLGDIELLRFGDRDYARGTGGELRVNSTIPSDQTDSAAAGLGNGGYVIVWNSNGQDGDGLGIYGQRFTANGLAVGGEFRVNATTAGFQSQSDICALEGGGFVVTWMGLADGANDVFARVYSATGTPLTGELTVNTTTDGSQEFAAVAALADGGFVVTWQGPDSDGLGVFAQRFDADGEAVLDEIQVNTDGAGDQFQADVAALLGGGFVIAWNGPDGDGGRDLWEQRYSATGEPLGAQLPSGLFDSAELPSVAALATGGYAIALTSGGDIHALRFTADGVVEGNPFVANQSTGLLQNSASIVGLDDGGFVIAWRSFNQDGDGTGVYARRFTASGNPDGDEFRLNGTTADGQHNPALAALAGGGFVATWESYGQDGDSAGVYQQQYDAQGRPLPPLIEGTAGNDVLDVSGAGALRAAGLAGDDRYVVDNALDQPLERLNEGLDQVNAGISFTLGANLERLLLTGANPVDGSGNALDNAITGNGAANVLRGNSGDDTLAGAGGADRLEGGGGADVLRGGGGNDTYLADAADTLSEISGAGNDTISTAVAWTLAQFFENLSLLGSTAVTGTGNGVANVLRGNNSANALLGLAGADTLRGGGGNDTLSGGGAADRFQFDTGLSTASNIDVVTDFVSGSDKLLLDDDIFTAFDAADSTQLSSAQIYRGSGATAAHDADDRIVYDTSSGALYYDADGLGGDAAIQFAQLGTGSAPALNATDFLIIS